MIRLVGAGAVGIALLASAPWIGWWTLILFALCALNFVNVDRRLRTSPHPERVSATAIVITLLLLGGGRRHQRRPRAAPRCPGWCSPRRWSPRAFAPRSWSSGSC